MQSYIICVVISSCLLFTKYPVLQLCSVIRTSFEPLREESDGTISSKLMVVVMLTAVYGQLSA